MLPDEPSAVISRPRRHSSSPCKGEEEWGSAAVPLAVTVGMRIGDVGCIASIISDRPATPTLILPLSGGGHTQSQSHQIVRR
jgi:hypothetical protein